MQHPWEVIKLLESDNSRLVKQLIIKSEADNSNDDFFDGCKLALNPMITFGIKKVDEKTDITGDGLSWNDFCNSVSSLIDRTCTGNLAKALIADLMSQATLDQWNYWYRRILIKDLRCGVSEKTLNSVLKKYPRYLIPVFTCQLAHDSNNHESKVKGKKQVEVKLDGIRVITKVYPQANRVEQYSRTGKELVNFEKIRNQILDNIHLFNEPTVLDGEVMSSSFQDLMKQARRLEDVQTDDAILHLFDMIPLHDFEAGICKLTQTERTSKLIELFESAKCPTIQIVGQEIIDLDTTEGFDRFQTINKLAIEGGYEGIMLKDPEAFYELKRSSAWLKLKPYIDVTLTLLHLEEGTGKYVGKLGAFVCAGEDSNKYIQVSVGSGFTDKERQDFWASKDIFVGRMVEIRADSITQNQNGSYSLRFPRFKCFRGFAPGEKI